MIKTQMRRENAPIPRAESTTSSRCCMYLWFKARNFSYLRSKEGIFTREN